MPAQPVVSVVMIVYNGERYLAEAIDSVLNQSFSDFELVVVDDGSTDGTAAILSRYREVDSRVRTMVQGHQGIPGSRNLGWRTARGKYIAWLDADDVSLPDRLEKQVEFLNRNPEVGIVSSCCWLIDTEENTKGLYEVPVDEFEIRWVMLLRNPFVNSSVMIRRNVVVEHDLDYDEDFEVAEDYELWTRLLDYTRGANIGEPLVEYRESQGATKTHREIMLANHEKIARRQIEKELPGFVISPDQVSELKAFAGAGGWTPELHREYSRIAMLYLRLFLVFMERHRGAAGLKRLWPEEIPRLAQKVVAAPWRPTTAVVLIWLIYIYPRLALHLTPIMLGGLRYRLKKHLSVVV